MRKNDERKRQYNNDDNDDIEHIVAQTNIQSEKMKYFIVYPNRSYDDIKPLYINLLKVK